MSLESSDAQLRVVKWLEQLGSPGFLEPADTGLNPDTEGPYEHQDSSRENKSLHVDSRPPSEPRRTPERHTAYHRDVLCGSSPTGDRRISQWILQTERAMASHATSQYPDQGCSSGADVQHHCRQRSTKKVKRSPSPPAPECEAFKQSGKRSPRFEKRQRHKTRQDRYEPYRSRRPAHKAKEEWPLEPESVEESGKRCKKAAPIKPTRDVVAKFVSDAILSGRVTVRMEKFE